MAYMVRWNCNIFALVVLPLGTLLTIMIALLLLSLEEYATGSYSLQEKVFALWKGQEKRMVIQFHPQVLEAGQDIFHSDVLKWVNGDDPRPSS